jgi:hypothetical protein
MALHHCTLRRYPRLWLRSCTRLRVNAQSHSRSYPGVSAWTLVSLSTYTLSYIDHHGVLAPHILLWIQCSTHTGVHRINNRVFFGCDNVSSIDISITVPIYTLLILRRPCSCTDAPPSELVAAVASISEVDGSRREECIGGFFERLGGAGPDYAALQDLPT